MGGKKPLQNSFSLPDNGYNWFIKNEEVDNLTIQQVVESYGTFAHGGFVNETVREWTEAGFTAEQVAEWLESRCFSPVSAKKLADAGLTPEQAATTTTGGLGGYADTMGYKVSNGDLNVADAVRETVNE